MRADALKRLSAIASGVIGPVPGGTPGTSGTTQVLPPSAHGTLAATPGASRGRNTPLFQMFQAFQVERDQYAEAERAAIAIVDGRVPTVYADAWAAYQIRKPSHATAREWYRAVNDAGRFLDAWAGLALSFGWAPFDIFGPVGLAWFCAGERIRALGPNSAITASGRVFARQASGQP